MAWTMPASRKDFEATIASAIAWVFVARIGSNVVWTPVKNFDIGGEIMYLRDNLHSRPVGLAPDLALLAFGVPSYRGSTGTVEGRLRLQRTF